MFNVHISLSVYAARNEPRILICEYPMLTNTGPSVQERTCHERACSIEEERKTRKFHVVRTIHERFFPILDIHVSGCEFQEVL